MAQILITGSPGVGKSTLIRRLCERLCAEKPELKIAGFYTAETRDSKGVRSGFEVITLPEDANSKRSPLATVNPPPGYRGRCVSKYTVMVEDFESTALPCLESASNVDVVVLDELGKMESMSSKFVASFSSWLSSGHRALLVATIPVSRGRALPMVELVQKKSETQTFTIDKGNRNEQLDVIYKAVLDVLT